jgi:hypothetical protein
MFLFQNASAANATFSQNNNMLKLPRKPQCRRTTDMPASRRRRQHYDVDGATNTHTQYADLRHAGANLLAHRR